MWWKQYKRVRSKLIFTLPPSSVAVRCNCYFTWASRHLQKHFDILTSLLLFNEGQVGFLILFEHIAAAIALLCICAHINYEYVLVAAAEQMCLNCLMEKLPKETKRV